MAASRASITLENGKLAVRFFYDAFMVEAVRGIDPRSKFTKDNGDARWLLPCEQYTFIKLCDLFGLDPANTARNIGTQLSGNGKTDEEIAGLIASLTGPPAYRKPQKITDRLTEIKYEQYQHVLPPFDHQKGGLVDTIENPRWGLFWDMGTGKSKAICDRICFGLQHGQFKNVLIICPKSVLSVWPRELMTHAKLPCHVIAGSQKQKVHAIETVKKNGGIGVINYELLNYIWPELRKVPWELVVADECQKIKRSTAIMSRRTRDIAENATYRYALSGTPAPNGPLDWFGVLLFLDGTGKLAGTQSKVAFEARYAIRKKLNNGGQMVIGYRDLEDLRRRVTSVSSRILKDDCLDLPPKTFVERTCTLGKEQRRVYTELKRAAVARLSKLKDEGLITVRHLFTESLRLLQIVGGFVKDDDGRIHAFDPNPKLELLGEVLDEIGDQPLVIWSIFLEELSTIAELLADRGRTVCVMRGTTSDADRAQAIDDFQNSRANTFLATPQTGGSGITLTAADYEVFFSRSYNLNDFLQAADRCHRIGQTRPVTITSLVAEESIDQRVSLSLQRKADLQEALMRSQIEDLL
jgi:SNF2 family DNA or RNA helicase